jgi:hypothetical protein
MSVGRVRSVIFAAIAALILSEPAAAQPTDTAVKAAFLPRFARYVTWPPAAMPRASNPFVLCIIGRDPFGTTLDDAVRSQLIDGRRIVVRRLDGNSTADGCQIAYLASAGNQFISTPGKPVLTVTDSANGSGRGIIHFVISEGRVRFFIDQRSAQQRGLSISSRLLALAIGVRQ